MRPYFSPTLQAWWLGPPPAEAARVWVCIHGRGADAGSILSLGQELAAAGEACVAPQARHGSWYPYSFMAPREANQPHLGQSLRQLVDLSEALAKEGLPPAKQVWTGFSQGACLMLEHVYTQAEPVAGVVAFSGGLIGPEGQVWPSPGTRLKGVPIFLSCSELDPHIPEARFKETATLLELAQARLHSELLPHHGHTITPDQIERARGWLKSL